MNDKDYNKYLDMQAMGVADWIKMLEKQEKESGFENEEIPELKRDMLRWMREYDEE